MAEKQSILNPEMKRKILAVMRILLLTAALVYLLIFISNNLFVDDQINVYFSTEDAQYLVAEQREIIEDDDLYFQIIAELNKGPESENLSATIPEEVELLEYDLDEDVLILNFNSALRENHWGGSTGELLTIYSIVNSYTALNEVQSVQILLEGQEVETLVGHLDLSRPLMYNQELVTDN
ncbi:GerMN domain-containing protein [Halanaerobium hydrogeniformans]|uniref:Lipoprotein LpqB, GerMN domain n=1 Tax=Halanaerobium hydrogeniformans TaxID=656519 RepID=E4RPV2_HALHG|nr:GerMN domain-containing protein [Halanaerobium hydrogeniformans]ADQ14319.1 Lipoprotein LpqB, GerMN domain [Halanaerobium hydrogeniformans]